LVYFKGKISIPANLRFHILTWYHENLLHPGTDWMFSYHLAAFHLAQPMHTSWKLCETLQHLPTLQGTEKEIRASKLVGGKWVWFWTFPNFCQKCLWLSVYIWLHWNDGQKTKQKLELSK
jgi:hypothetical protein